MRNLFIAIQFLTRFSIRSLPDTKDIKPKDIGASMALFSLVGALIGCALAGAYYLFGLFIADKPMILAGLVKELLDGCTLLCFFCF